jgi:Ankyrin repeats (3 copies)
LGEIKATNWEFAQRLLQCVAVVSRPLRIEELAEFLAFDFKEGPIPKYREDWRLEDPTEAVLSTCSTLLAVVNVDDSPVIQFSHFSVKEFLTSSRFAQKGNTVSQCYHISPIPSHTLVAQACLSILLHLGKNVTRDGLVDFPLAQYAAEHWFEHARFEGVSGNVDEGIRQLFDRRKPHFAVWLWICDPAVPSWQRNKSAGGLVSPHGTALHYAALCGLNEIVKVLAIEHPEDMDSRSFDGESTPLHLASKEGHVEVARLLIERGADVAAQTRDGSTSLHRASFGGNVQLARLLIEHGADAAAQTKDGSTPLHLVSLWGHVELARLLIEHGADAAAQAKDGSTPLHLASSWGHMELARLLIEHGADDGSTPQAFSSTYHHHTPRHPLSLLAFHDPPSTPGASDGVHLVMPCSLGPLPTPLQHRHLFSTPTSSTSTPLQHRHLFDTPASSTPRPRRRRHLFDTDTSSTPTPLRHRHFFNTDTSSTLTPLQHRHLFNTHHVLRWWALPTVIRRVAHLLPSTSPL